MVAPKKKQTNTSFISGFRDTLYDFKYLSKKHNNKWSRLKQPKVVAHQSGNIVPGGDCTPWHFPRCRYESRRRECLDVWMFGCHVASICLRGALSLKSSRPQVTLDTLYYYYDYIWSLFRCLCESEPDESPRTMPRDQDKEGASQFTADLCANYD